MARSRKGPNAFTVTFDESKLSPIEKAQLENSGTGPVREITPLWRMPRDDIFVDEQRKMATFDNCYHQAIVTLKDQICPDLNDHEKTGFFFIRDLMWKACEKWRCHDWEADRAELAERRKGEKSRPKLVKATQMFRKELANSAFRQAERDLGVIITRAMIPDGRINMTYSEGVDAVAKALEHFHDVINPNDEDGKMKMPPPIRYGPLEYAYLPKSFPSPEIALAIVLADIFTCWRRDEHQGKNVRFGRPAKFSPNTPWKAIYEFSFPESQSGDVRGNPENIQSLAKSNAKNVARIHP